MNLSEVVTFPKLSRFLDNLRQELTVGYIPSSSFCYEDIYFGIGETAASIKIAANHYDEVVKGTIFPFTSVNGRIWMIAPEDYIPVIEMASIGIPLVLDSSYEEEGVTYKVWKSVNVYAGTFSVTLQ